MLNYSLHVIRCVEDDGVVKPVTTEKQIWLTCMLHCVIINADVYAYIVINFFKCTQLLLA